MSAPLRIENRFFINCEHLPPSQDGGFSIWRIDVYRTMSVDIVGATIGRPCGEIVRFCMGFRRIRSIVPRRAGNARPYIPYRNSAIN